MAHHYTFDKLAKNAYRLNPKTRGPNYPFTPRFEFAWFSSGPNKDQKVVVPFKGTNTLLISMKAWGVTQASLHNITLLFSNVDILTENPNSSDYFQVQYKGVMYWVHKLDRFRNPLTSRCTCFTGDTKVLLADGTSKTFKELEGQEFEVCSFDYKNNCFVKAKAGNSNLKKVDASLIELTLDDGYKIKCTPDHLFHLYNTNNKEELCEAHDLLGKSLKHLYGIRKVINIKSLDNDDVYCLTVPIYSNFCLANGVVVANCRDFFFTAAFYNNRAGCLYGPPPKPYIRKTTTRPPRNPAGLVLCCKHIYNSWAVLRNSGLTIN